MIGILKGLGSLSGTIKSDGNLSVTVTIPRVIPTPAFEGDYEYIPTDVDHTIPISGLRAIQNIVIKAIPSNYGHISWDGTSVRVY